MLEATAVRVSAQGQGSLAGEKHVTIETRFGPLVFGPENSLYMPVGPLGFGNHHNFGLAELPNPRLAKFRLLQCLDDTELSFIVTPLRIEDRLVEREDLVDAALSVGISMDTAAFLLIITVRPDAKGTRITANLRAPIVVDPHRAVARQVVMANSKYPIQAPL